MRVRDVTLYDLVATGGAALLSSFGILVIGYGFVFVTKKLVEWFGYFFPGPVVFLLVFLTCWAVFLFE